MSSPVISILSIACRRWLLAVVAGFFFCLPSVAQKVTIKGKGLSIRQVLKEINRQTGYSFVYETSIPTDAPILDINCDKDDIRHVLRTCFEGLHIRYEVDHWTISVFLDGLPDSGSYLPVRGRVQDMNGDPLEGATITVDGGPRVICGVDGSFRCLAGAKKVLVSVSHIGYLPSHLFLSAGVFEVIRMQPSPSILDSVVVYDYVTGLPKYATGSFSRVGAETISRTVAGISEELEGKVPGLAIRQYNGMPGSAFGTLIRGTHTIQQGSEPLIVVDGVPIAFSDNYLSFIGSGSAQGPMGASVFNGIPLSAIGNIEVLKDAAATSIYGSRGANGVILLNLNKGRAGLPRLDVDISSGVDAAVKTSPLLNTEQYLELRKEAVRNDGLPVNANTVPELFRWDSTRYTDYKKMLTGDTRDRLNASVTCSGGDTNMVYLLSGSYHRESAVSQGATSDDRSSVHGSLHRQMDKGRFRIDLSTLYNRENNRLPIQDPAAFVYLAPNAPSFLDAGGHPIWNQNQNSYLNIHSTG